ncbi:DDE_3 domain-containing protein [Trichonephila clavipes]|nr:DDE_3 domain-containing protein [Trichonephila clavipes]
MDQWVTDESRFCLNTDSCRTFIWREPGTCAIYPPMSTKSTNTADKDLHIDEYLEGEDIRRMDCPARRSDFKPIGHVGDSLGRSIATRNSHSANHPGNENIVAEQVGTIATQDMINCLISNGTEDDYLFMEDSNCDGENDTDFDDVPEDITEDEYADLFMLSNFSFSVVSEWSCSWNIDILCPDDTEGTEVRYK